MHFTKMQAYGNDYVYVDVSKLPENINWNEVAIQISDRHFGVGGDGLVLICPSKVADFRMRIFDPDGTEAEMCGNAVRSVAKFVYYHKMTDKTTLTIETLGGIKNLYLTVENDEVVNIEAEIGKPIFNPELIPVDTEGEEFVDETVKVNIGGRMTYFRMSSLSWGNPHTVIFMDDLENLDIETIGPAIENHVIFPKRTNVTFAKVVDEHTIQIREWERGCGETIGCGTGCCTALVFANRLGMCAKDATVMQIGGPLEVIWDEKGLVHMKGPSHVVFEGDYIYEA
ncbi:MAG: diaminopimelate epimerase [Lachnospiraceae bacterium]|nr:diaminopimelate epimerase [Lachnospiraceae bacterium]